MDRWIRDVVAIAIALACVLLLRWTPYDDLIIVLVPPLIIAACLGGLRFALVMTAATTLASAYFLAEPLDSLEVHASGIVRLLALVSSGVLVAVLCDMLRRAKQRAERSERMYQESFHASPIPLVLSDVASGTVLDANDAYVELVGWSRDELRSLSAEHRNIASFDDVRAEVARTGSIRNAHVHIRRKTGESRDGILSSVVVEHDGVQRFLTTVLDVTEQKLAERRFTELATTIDEVFWLTDVAKQRVFYISPAYERLWGRSCDSLYLDPRRWMDDVHPDDRARVFVDAMPGPGQGAPEIEFRIRRPDGEVRWIRNKSFRIHDANGKLVRMAGVATDVTDRRKLELELQHAQRMESLGRLAGGVAHDFNNVLAVIATNSSILSEVLPETGEAHEMVEEIEHAVARATSLTRQLLVFSRKQHAEPVVLDVNATLNETRKMLRRMIGEDVALDTSFDPDLPYVLMDPGHLVQVVMNLAVNARDAMPGGGKLVIETRDASNGTRRIMLLVRDTGTGMSAEVRARIFEPFFTTKGATKGTGMGLAVVHGIVEQAGGTIEVDSELGRGTTFRIYLPVTDRSLEALHAGAAKTLPRGYENVLVVDDDPHVREVTTRALRASGYRALSASDGSSALRMLAREPIDLLVTDVVMPGMNGRELAESALRSLPSLKVLYTSGYTDDEVVARGVMRGEVEMLDKPFRVDKLAAKVRQILDAT